MSKEQTTKVTLAEFKKIYSRVFNYALKYKWTLSISIFSSSITSNQIIAFLLAIILNVTIYYGFELLATIEGLQSIDLVIKKMGISYHFELMSKGVISTDDIVYFLSVICLFLKLTEFSLIFFMVYNSAHFIICIFLLL